MYICPICGRNFVSESKMAKHLLICWKEKNPNHISKEAPRSANVMTRQVNNDILDFFSSLRKE